VKVTEGVRKATDSLPSKLLEIRSTVKSTGASGDPEDPLNHMKVVPVSSRDRESLIRLIL
jgi:hypothetical protein